MSNIYEDIPKEKSQFRISKKLKKCHQYETKFHRPEIREGEKESIREMKDQEVRKIPRKTLTEENHRQ